VGYDVECQNLNLIFDRNYVNTSLNDVVVSYKLSVHLTLKKMGCLTYHFVTASCLTRTRYSLSMKLVRSTKTDCGEK